MLKVNFLKRKLDSGKTVVGTWSVIPSPVVADIIASSGLDFLVIDQEHGPAGFETAQAMVMACESRGVSPLIRVGGPQEGPEILRALETGAHGLHIPNVQGPKLFRQAFVQAKYPPLGQRGFSPFTRASGYTHLNAAKIQAAANASTLLAVHLEDKTVMEALDDLLENCGADIFFIGLFDLSKSLGIPGQIEHPRLRRLFKEIVLKILAAGKVPGTIVTGENQLKKMIFLGVRYLTYSADCEMLLRAYQAAHRQFLKSPRRHFRRRL